MLGMNMPAREYWAIPDAIPEAVWLVVAVRDGKAAETVAVFDDYDAAYADAERRTKLTQIISF